MSPGRVSYELGAPTRGIPFPQRSQQAFAAEVAYSWQSAHTLTVGPGHKLYADRAGGIAFIRAERSSADGGSEAIFDVLLNDVSMFVTADKPNLLAGEGLGAERVPDAGSLVFQNGDSFQVVVESTGGGTGPLRVTIHFQGL